MPFTHITILGHIHIYEIVLLPLVFFLPIIIMKDVYSSKFLFLDIAVFLYFLDSIISVVVDWSDLYLAARNFRALVLSPTLLYLVIRLSFLDLKDIRRALFFLIPGILIQSAIFIYQYLLHGLRPRGIENVSSSTITLSFLFCVGILILFYFKGNIRSDRSYIIKVMAAIVLMAALLLSFTRMVIAGFILIFPLSKIIWSKYKYRNYVSSFVIIGMIVILGLISIFPNNGNHIYVKDEKQIQKSYKRLLHLELYFLDINERFTLWSTIAKKALKNSILGSGLSSYQIKQSNNAKNSLGSSHNVLISALVVGGIPGILILFLLILGTYNSFKLLPNNFELKGQLGNVLFVSFTILLLVGLTNDFSGGRIYLFFLIIALSARLVIISEG